MPCANRRKASLTALVLVVSALAGCAEKGITCSDESAVRVVKTIYQNGMKTVLAATPDSAAVKTQIEAATSVEIRSIRTTGKDEKLGQVSCEAELAIRVPADLAKAIATPGNLLNAAVQSLSVKVNGDWIEKEVRYTAQKTDDKEQVVVQAAGAPDMGQLIATLAVAGWLKIVSAPPTVPEAPGNTAVTPTATAPVASAPSEAAIPAGAVHTNSATEGNEEATPSAASTTANDFLPSFPCTGKLSPPEKLICDTPDLAVADLRLARLYQLALAKPEGRDELKQAQRAWRASRDACNDAACIASAYRDRSQQLGQ